MPADPLVHLRGLPRLARQRTAERIWSFAQWLYPYSDRHPDDDQRPWWSMEVTFQGTEAEADATFDKLTELACGNPDHHALDPDCNFRVGGMRRVGDDDPGYIIPEDFVTLGNSIANLYLQAINGVVCDPTEEPGRRNCATCREAFARAKDVLDRYDPKWGNGFRPGPAFQPGSDDDDA